jgi:predicted nucleic acid-binding protein
VGRRAGGRVRAASPGGLGISRIFWDTNLFIYLFEGAGERLEPVRSLLRRMVERNDQLYASTLTLGEVLVKPLQHGNESLRLAYEDAFSRTAVLVPFGAEAARIYATIRQDRAVRAPDAIQLACAAHAHVDLFITNDERLSRATIPGVQFVVSLDRAFL